MPNVLAQYDTFGRVVAATAQDGSVARTEYHASSVITFDPNDDPSQNPDFPQDYGTPHVSRSDGHGRTIETVEMLRQPGELATATHSSVPSCFGTAGPASPGSEVSRVPPDVYIEISTELSFGVPL